MSKYILVIYYRIIFPSFFIFCPVIVSANSFDFGPEICDLLDCFLNNSVVMLIATVAITFLGISAFFGKVNWGLVIVVGAGVIVIAGAEEIAQLFTGAPPCADNTCNSA